MVLNMCSWPKAMYTIPSPPAATGRPMAGLTSVSGRCREYGDELPRDLICVYIYIYIYVYVLGPPGP